MQIKSLIRGIIEKRSLSNLLTLQFAEICRGFIKFLCRRSVGFFSQVFLVFLIKESKKRRRKQPSKVSFTSGQFVRCPALNEPPGYANKL